MKSLPNDSELPSEAHATAAAVAHAMFAQDVATRETMGMTVLACGPGFATLSMLVTPKHLNGHRICHGGFIFTLADSSFAFACNSRNQLTLASGCSIEFVKPGQPGDLLTCEAIEQSLSGRHGVYDARVSNQRGELVALFRGKSAQIAGTVLPSA